MAKLTKQDIRTMKQVMDLVNSDKVLTYEEKVFILENYQEGATNVNSALGAFFTPLELTNDFLIDCPVNKDSKVIDMCAGIGKLSFLMVERMKICDFPVNLTCVEYNQEYLRIGKRIIPEATWIHGDVLSVDLDNDYTLCISNPPFGNIKTEQKEETKLTKYNGSAFEYKVIERACQVAEHCVFILPQGSAPFTYSGKNYYQEVDKFHKSRRLMKDLNCEMYAGCGVDTSIYKDEWNGTKVICEIVIIIPEGCTF